MKMILRTMSCNPKARIYDFIVKNEQSIKRTRILNFMVFSCSSVNSFDLPSCSVDFRVNSSDNKL